MLSEFISKRRLTVFHRAKNLKTLEVQPDHFLGHPIRDVNQASVRVFLKIIRWHTSNSSSGIVKFQTELFCCNRERVRTSKILSARLTISEEAAIFCVEYEARGPIRTRCFSRGAFSDPHFLPIFRFFQYFFSKLNKKA